MACFEPGPNLSLVDSTRDELRFQRFDLRRIISLGRLPQARDELPCGYSCFARIRVFDAKHVPGETPVGPTDSPQDESVRLEDKMSVPRAIEGMRSACAPQNVKLSRT